VLLSRWMGRIDDGGGVRHLDGRSSDGGEE
jgi:hypothetical protein